MRKWEYCLAVYWHSFINRGTDYQRQIHSGQLRQLTPKGHKIVKDFGLEGLRPTDPDKELEYDERNADKVYHDLERMIANLGLQGWEMIQIENLHPESDDYEATTENYWFKRPIEE